MKYLENTLRLKNTYQNWDKEDKLPYFLLDRYRIQKVLLGSTNVFFLFPKGNLETITAIKKHIAFITKIEQLPVVLILERCSYRQRKALIENGISFVVENKQIYLPFMGTYLQEIFDPEPFNASHLLPSAQLLLFYYIYSKKQELPMSGLEKKFELSAMSVSRAVKQLEEAKLIRTFKLGVNKIMTSSDRGKDLYEKAMPLLQSPVKKEGYVEKDILLQDSCKAGLSALSEYSMLNPPAIETKAVSQLKEVVLQPGVVDTEKEQRIQIWSYNPFLLAKNDCIDILSLHQSLKDNQDERIQKELQETLNNFWKSY